MNTARILSIAAVAALTSLGAQAGQYNGERYGADYDAGFQSTRTRAEVLAEARQPTVSFKDFYVEPVATKTASLQTREAVRQQARIAARAHQIATGELS